VIFESVKVVLYLIEFR